MELPVLTELALTGLDEGLVGGLSSSTVSLYLTCLVSPSPSSSSSSTCLAGAASKFSASPGSSA